MNYTISLPEEVTSGKHARLLLERALDYQLAPIRAKRGPLKQIALYLPAVIEARIQSRSDAAQWDQSELMGRLICAALKEGPPAAKYEAAGWNRNRVQDEMVAILKRAIALHQIALLEGSTGIGKSRVQTIHFGKMWVALDSYRQLCTRRKGTKIFLRGGSAATFACQRIDTWKRRLL